MAIIGGVMGAGGVDTQLQYNNAGVLGGMAGVTWDGSALALTSAATLLPAGAGADSVRVGSGATAAGASSIVGGAAASSTVDAVESVVFGYSAAGSGGSYVTAVGPYTIASAESALAVGDSATAESLSATAVGGYIADVGTGSDHSVAVGSGATVADSCPNAMAAGPNSVVSSPRALAVGFGAIINAGCGESIAFGIDASIGAGVTDAIAIGHDASVSGTSGSGIAMGFAASVLGTSSFGSIAIGYNAVSRSKAVALGEGAQADGTTSSTAIGSNARAAGPNAVCLGEGTYVEDNSDGSMALGTGAFVDNVHDNAMALGTGAKSIASNMAVLGYSGEPTIAPAPGITAHADTAAISLYSSGQIITRGGSTKFAFTYVEVKQVLSGALSGATVTLSSLIPAGSVLLGITTRVATTITGATGYDVGDGVNATRWGSNIALAQGTTSDNTDGSDAIIAMFPAAQDVVLTAQGSDFTAGEVTVCAHILRVDAPQVD